MDAQDYNHPEIQIRPNGICVYTPAPGNKDRTEAQRANESNLTRGTYNGYMSPKTQGKVKAYLSTWIEGLEITRQHYWHQLPRANKLITFVTLTLPSKQKHTDNQIKRSMFGPYLQSLVRKYKVKYWYWRAEPQINGNIHFHVIMDAFVPWKDIRREWNSILDRYGYITPYREKHKRMSVWDYIKAYREPGKNNEKELIQRFNRGKKEGWNNPNTTDIHKVREIDNLTGYVIKYMCKSGESGIGEKIEQVLKGSNATDEEKDIIIDQIRSEEGYRKVQGRIHGGSDSLRELRYPVDILSHDWDDLIGQLKEDETIWSIEDDYYSYYALPVKDYLKAHFPKLFQLYIKYYYHSWRLLYQRVKVQAEIDQKRKTHPPWEGITAPAQLEPQQAIMEFTGTADDWAGSKLEEW